jgi:hypothetical protein
MVDELHRRRAGITAVLTAAVLLVTALAMVRLTPEVGAIHSATVPSAVADAATGGDGGGPATAGDRLLAGATARVGTATTLIEAPRADRRGSP